MSNTITEIIETRNCNPSETSKSQSTIHEEIKKERISLRSEEPTALESSSLYANAIKAERVEDEENLKRWTIKHEGEITQNQEDQRIGDIFLERTQEFIKIENSEEVKEIEERCEIVLDEWKIKHEEIDIKTEDLENNELRVSSNGIDRKNNENSTIQKCHKCVYQTMRKGNLKMHLLTHKNQDKVDMFKCYHCDYKTTRKNNLKVHLLKYKNPEEVKMFNCDKCDYKSRWKNCLTRHCLIHQNPDEIDVFTCYHCDYRTLRKQYLKAHLKNKNPKKVAGFKCTRCVYQTIYKCAIKKHGLLHK